MEDTSATKDVQTMLGDPKKAILLFSIPIAVAFIVQQGNNIVDSIWVTGLGGSALAALGIVYPIYSIAVSIGNGLGIGAAASIARNIGKHDRHRASLLASQSITMMIIIGVILTPILLLTARPLLMAIGAGGAIEDSLAYAYPIYMSTLLILMSGMLSGILRGEGAIRKSVYIQILAAIINLVLDPIFIYTFGWGVAGAAWATVIAFAASVILGLYWYFAKKGMFLELKLSAMRFNISSQKEILNVGLPESIELIIMSVFNIGNNICVIMIGGTDAVAIYTIGWRLAFILMIPTQALGAAMVSACSAEFGMKRYDLIYTAYRYSLKLSLIWLIVLSAIMALGAGYIASAFTYAPDMLYMHDETVRMIYSFAVLVPFMALVFTGQALLLSMNRANVTMVSTLIRNTVLTGSFFVMAYTVGTLGSLWIAMIVSEVFGGFLMAYFAHVVSKGVDLNDRKIIDI